MATTALETGGALRRCGKRVYDRREDRVRLDGVVRINTRRSAGPKTEVVKLADQIVAINGAKHLQQAM